MSTAQLLPRRPSWYRFPVSQRRLVRTSQGGKIMTRGFKLAAVLCVCVSAGAGSAVAQSQVVGAPPEASGMKLAGTSDLQARSGYQPTIHHQGERWIAYIGHHGGTDDIPAPVNP